MGGGIIVNDGHRVDWMVNGLAGDALHKTGKGTLVVAGSGENPGTLNTGDGTVILAQKADAAGRVRHSVKSVLSADGRLWCWQTVTD